MADKILKIKLEVDTGQTAKLSTSLDGINDKTKQLLELNKQARDLENSRQVAIEKTQAAFARLNNAQEKGSLNASLTYNAAITSLNALNKKLEENLRLTNSIASQKNALSGGFAFASNNYTGGNGSKPQEGQRSRNALTGAILQSEQEVADKIAKMKEAIGRTSNAVLEQQTKDRLAREVEANRLAAQKAVNSQSFAQRLNSVPRVASQGSQIDITGTLSRYLKQQTAAQAEAEAAAKAHAKALDNLGEKHRSLVTRIVEAVSIYRVYNSILNTTINSIKAIPDIGIQLEATKSILAATVGSETAVASVLATLNKEAERTGISVAVLRESFRTFNASALLAGESTETAYRIFTNLNTTITSLHLSADLAQHTFLAFSQILNKGKVQSEELVKQLGNLLPGAFATMAKALNISTQELSVRMKKGLVLAHDSLDAFAKEYAQQFSQSFVIAQQGLNANIGRLQTSFTLLGESIYSQTSGAMVNFVKGLTSITNELRFVIEGTSKWNYELGLLKNTIEAAIFIGFSASVAGLITRFSAVTAGTVGLAASLTKLRSAFSFLSLPTAIVSGILLIANQLKEAISPAETLIDKLRQSREEAENIVKQNAARANLSEAGKITFDVENSAEVKTKFNEIKGLAEELEATKQRLNNSKFNPFASVNDIQKDKAFIAEGTKELKLQLKEFENLKNAKKLQLEADAISAKAKERDFVNPEEAKQTPVKELNFNKETALNDKIKKQLEEKYKFELSSLQLKQKDLELTAKIAAEQGNPIASNDTNSKLNSLKQQELALTESYNQKLVALAVDSQNKINAAVKTIPITIDQALKAIQEIESAGNPGAVSRTGAIGLRQVQPSTLKSPGLGLKGIDVPQEILNAEKASKAGIATKTQKDALKQYALDNVEVLAEFGIKYYKALVGRYKGDFIRAAAAYNAGPGNEDKGIRPKETKDYVNKFVSKTGGEGYEPALLSKQTEQQAALDAQRTAAQDKFLLKKERELEIATLAKKVREEEIQLGIDLSEAKGLTKEAELAKVRAEFTERYAQAEALGSEFLRKRLPVLEQARIKQIELKALEEKYSKNERKFQGEVQELTNKALVGKLRNYNATLDIVKLQDKYIQEQKIILQAELELAQTEEQRVAIADKLAQLKQKQVETASFNTTFTASPERQQFESNAAAIDSSKSESLNLAKEDYEKALQERSLTAFEDYQARKQEIEDRYIQASILNQANLYGHMAGTAAESFSSITSAMVRMYGQQSQQARIAFAAQKAFAAGQAAMNTYSAATKAYAEGGPYAGPVLAAIVTAAGLANVANILSQPVPAAHGGMTNVPKEQTYLLDKGERVLSPKQNVDITNKVTNIHDKVSNGNAGGKQANIRIVNVSDENLVYNALGSDQSERIIMNIVNRNR